MISQAPPPERERGKRAPKGPHPLGPLAKSLAEVQQFGAYYLATRWDAVVSGARRGALLAAAGLVGLLAAGATIVVSVVLLLAGASAGIGVALGGRLWAGQLIVGFGVLAMAAAAVLLATSYLKRRFRRKTVKKYESQRHAQRVQLGRDVAGRVAGQ